jgi:hypothetical protein
MHRIANRPRRTVAGLAGAVAVALAISVGADMAWADDEEDVPLDTKLFRQLMKDLGLLRDGESIEYRERAPLVVPPSRNLPPPQSGTAVTNNPAWPNDPDVQQRKQRTETKRNRRPVSETMEAEARPLPRSELDRGSNAAVGRGQGSPSPEDGARPMKPSELGSKGLLGGLFSGGIGNKTENTEFTGEPVRESLTAPPTGYQTPSPNHPYGTGPWRPAPAKPTTFEDRVTGETR